MRRPLVSEEQENEAKLIPGRVQTVSFAVWNGENKERNGQKAVAPWFQLSSIRLRNFKVWCAAASISIVRVPQGSLFDRPSSLEHLRSVL